MAEKIREIDWGDGTIIKVKTPDLSGLDAIVCPPACNPPDGDERMEQGVGHPIRKVTPQLEH